MSKNKNIPKIERIIQSNSLLRRIARRWRFRKENKLISNKLKAKSNKPSILHFSFNKAATQYVRDILKKCATQSDIIHIGIHEFAFYNKFPYLDRISREDFDKNYSYLFKSKGILYSVFGGFIEGIPDFESYKVVLVVRDPRDILVSKYFSRRFIHEVPIEESGKQQRFLKRREIASKMEIDEFVLMEKEGVLQNFEKYTNQLIDKYTHIHVTSYEKMIGSFDVWLKELIEYCELEVDQSLFNELVSQQNRKKPKSEDIYNHDRKGVHGDYLEKLKPETIGELNRYFDKYLNKFGYQIN